ncbi:unnamed protein product [Closterium sp. NIES-65]|nr:unnamed protein product [Closterium sp. NIES-65]
MCCLVQAGESLWAHATGDLPAPDDPTPLGSALDGAARACFASQRADLTARKSRDAAACIALSSLLPESEEAHFTQVCTASEFLTAIKARYTTPTTISLGRVFLPFLFPDLASFERSADLIAHLRSLDSSYRAACTDVQLVLLPPPMAITIYFIATSLPDRLASVRDTLLLKHPSELTIDVLESALKDIESNLCSVASASGVVPPPLFHGCTVPQLPTFTASLTTTATDVTAAAVTTSSQSRGRGGKRGGQGTGGGGGGGVGGGGGGGGVPTGGGGSAGPGEASCAAAGDPATAAGGGDARARQPPSGLPAAAGGAAAWNLVGVRPLVSQHVGVWIEPSGETAVAASPQVAVSGQVPMSGPVAASCSCRSLAHPTVLWHHRTGHPSLPRLRAMSCQRLVLGLPRVLPSLSPSLAPVCSPCVEDRLRATPHSSSLRPAIEPFETLHLDVWGPAPRLGHERERFFLVVDDYSRYTTVFPLAKKSEVTSTLITWLLTTKGTRGRRVSCLHSDRGGEFHSGILAGFCREQGIRQSWTLPESPQQDGVAECRIGLVMEIARTSLTHARAPHFLWPYAVRYAAHQLNLWPRVSRPEASPTSLWTGSPGVATRFRVWGCLALVRDTSADKLSPRAVPCVFLGFPEDSSDFTFYHPPSHRFFDSRDVRFEESTPYYVRYPSRGVSQATPPSSVATQVQPPSPQSSSQPTADPVGAGAREEGPKA